MPLSMQVTSTPSITSAAFPVGSRAPQVDPAASGKFWSTGAAVPGTPSIRASPSYVTAPPGVSMVTPATWSLLTM